MPQVTKAQLAAALEASTNQVKSLQEDLRVERAVSTAMESALDKMHARMARLEKENEDLKNKVRRGCDRSRSPRAPATNSHVNVDVACKALNQVSLWQHDGVLKEHKAEIQRLQAEVASLRRGEGPVGEVLAHVSAQAAARVNHTRAPDVAAALAEQFAQQTRPVHEYIEIAEKATHDLLEFLGWNGVRYNRTALPPRQ